MFKYQSGRVISLGRAMLSLLFLLTIWLDDSQPMQTVKEAYGLLIVYMVFSLVVAALTWRNWWLDARLSIPAHFVDMGLFTGIIFSTYGYTSPFYLFFMLPLLSAALRWGWRETTLTATALILLYLTAGLLVAGSHTFELQRFIIRSAHLVILSAVLIWFGIHQQVARLFVGVDELDRLGFEEDSLKQALDFAIEAVSARSGALLLGSDANDHKAAGLLISNGSAKAVRIDRPLMLQAVPVALFALEHDRSLSRRSDGMYRFMPASRLLEVECLREFGAAEGLIAEVRTGTQSGSLVLWDVADLSVDFIELGIELGRAAGAVLDRVSLLSATEEGAAARTRLSLARDVHDSVVQFLAGATFRVEAMMRGEAAGAQVEADLKELKRLLIEEQSEIRTFVSALRRDRELELTEAVEELKSLALRLGEQWSIDCRVEASNDDASIPIRLQLDLQQLLREAVANAVRHGGASQIDVDVGVDAELLRLEVTDNGSGFVPMNGGSPVQPWSLKERVERAHGSLSLHSKPGRTNIVITLPLTGAPA